MNKKIDVTVTGEKLNYLISRIYKLKIPVYKIRYLKESIIITIDETNLEKLEKFNPSYEYTLTKYYGLKYIELVFRNKIFFVFYNLIGLAILFFISNFIVRVEVVHENKNLRYLINTELEDYKIRSGSYKKSYDTLQKIKKDITENHKKEIEWLEITKVGMKYVVNVEERIIIDNKTKETFCHLIATKSGIITNIDADVGQSKVIVNDYVKKGDILVSGEIKLNEVTKNEVCAKGEVYAEVWYTVTVNLPVKLIEKEFTDKVRYNISFDTRRNSNKIFRPQFEYFDTDRKKIFSLFGFSLYYDKEYEYKELKRDYTIEELSEYAEKLAIQKINLKLNDKESIISKKVLKKTIIDSTMNMDLFIVANEIISQQVVATKEEVEE